MGAQLGEYRNRKQRDFDGGLACAAARGGSGEWAGAAADPIMERRSATARGGRIGPTADPRAVGPPTGATRITVMVPGNQVIGADGSLTGYGGGVERKRLLLDFEGGVLSLT